MLLSLILLHLIVPFTSLPSCLPLTFIWRTVGLASVETQISTVPSSDPVEPPDPAEDEERDDRALASPCMCLVLTPSIVSVAGLPSLIWSLALSISSGLKLSQNLKDESMLAVLSAGT